MKIINKNVDNIISKHNKNLCVTDLINNYKKNKTIHLGRFDTNLLIIKNTRLMKIGFPYLHHDGSDRILMDLSFNTCTSFGIYDSSTKHTTVKDVRSILKENRSNLSTFFALEAVDILLTPECSPMAARYFSNNDITVFKTTGNDLEKNLDLLDKEKLSSFHAGNVIKSSCSSDCGSCSSSACK